MKERGGKQISSQPAQIKFIHSSQILLASSSSELCFLLKLLDWFSEIDVLYLSLEYREESA